MSESAEVIALEPHLAMKRAYRIRLYEEMVAAKRAAEKTDRLEDYDVAAKAYRAFMQAHLSEPEQEVIRLEQLVLCLRAEIRELRRQLSRAG